MRTITFPKSNILLNIVLAVITIGLYLPILGKGFSAADDHWMLFQNKYVLNMSPSNIAAYFGSY
ncbi:MAG TPA: hypothetical protein VGN20_27680 [Mucilaginibacter sp.]|jgi:hypothetical protein